MINKKAQISIEVTIVLAILVIGAVSLGVYYISNVNRYKEEANKLDDNLNKLEDQGEFGEEESVPATCSDGVQNQGEAGVDCGGPCNPCITTPPPSPFNNISVSSVNSSYVTMVPFSIVITTNIEDVNITDLMVTRDGELTNDCKPTPGTEFTYGKYVDLGKTTGTPAIQTINITNCKELGTYKFTFKGKYNDHSITADAIEIKITENNFNSVLLTSSSGSYYVSTSFLININTNVPNTEIKEFSIKRKDDGSPTPNCTTTAGTLVSTGFYKDLGFTNASGALLVPIFCDIVDTYLFSAKGKYLEKEVQSNSLQVKIEDTPPPIVLLLSVNTAPKFFEYFMFSKDMLAKGYPNVMLNLDILSNYDNTMIKTIEIKKKVGSSIYQPTNACKIKGLTEDDVGIFNDVGITEPRNFLIKEVYCEDYGVYRFRVEGGIKDSTSIWSDGFEISINDALAYTDNLATPINTDFEIFVYSEKDKYQITDLYIEKEITSDYYEASDGCQVYEGHYENIGIYTNLGQTKGDPALKSIMTNCSDKGNFRFTYVVEDPSEESRVLEPLYITVKK